MYDLPQFVAISDYVCSVAETIKMGTTPEPIADISQAGDLLNQSIRTLKQLTDDNTQDLEALVNVSRRIIQLNEVAPIHLPFQLQSTEIIVPEDRFTPRMIKLEFKTIPLTDITWKTTLAEQEVSAGLTLSSDEDGSAYIVLPYPEIPKPKKPEEKGHVTLHVAIHADYYKGLTTKDVQESFYVDEETVQRQWNNSIARPVSRTAASEAIGYVPDEILAMWEAQVADSNEIFTVLDLDENIFDTAAFWVEYTNTFLAASTNSFDFENTFPPTLEQVIQEGGPSKYYAKHFAHVFPGNTYDTEFMEELRFREPGNRKGPVMHQDMPGKYQNLEQQTTILGGLTARPDSEVVVQSTRQQFQENGLPEIPTIFRPADIQLSQSSQVKLDILGPLSEKTNGVILLVDDSISTAKKIQEYNRNRGRKPKLIQVVNIQGTLTAPAIARGEYAEDPDNGIFFMNGWDDQEAVLTRINKWKSSLN